MRHLGLVTLAVLLVLVGAAEAGPPDPRMIVRDVRTCDQALRAIDGQSIVHNADAILFVFDAVTFDAPPGHSEFSSYRPDVTRWLDALEAWVARRAARGGGPGRETRAAPRGGGPIHAAVTFSARPLIVGSPAWRKRIQGHLSRPWWSDDAFKSFEPATSWMNRLLGSLPGKRRMLVLVTGDLLPERMADRSHSMDPGREVWRRKLLRVGQYWDEEAIGRRLERKNVVLDVIAPEARFCDFWPLQEIPELPWAARPDIRIHPNASEQLRLIKELIESRGVSPEGQKVVTSGLPAERFETTVCNLATEGSFLFFNTDCPSGFGYWPFARAVAITGGRYVFYPFPQVRFLDHCPYDPLLMRRLAPEMSSLPAIVKSKAGDAALAALLSAVRIVIGKTDWSDALPRAATWSGYTSVFPPTLDQGHRERDKPIRGRLAPPASWPQAVVQRGESLRKVIPYYDRAIALLEKTERRIASGDVFQPHRRSMANLRLGRFWLEMSAFHLEALSYYCMDFHAHLAAMKKKHGPSVDVMACTVMFMPTIRMSDCLEGYDRVSISVERDRELQRERDVWLDAIWRPGTVGLPAQSNTLLSVRKTSPEYRALRHPGEVFKHLDPRLLDRALRMVDAARNVMAHDGRSPWGWMVYYTNAHTCVLPAIPGEQDPPADPPVTPPPDVGPGPRPTPTPPSGPSTGGK
jgi:hypothetical protein